MLKPGWVVLLGMSVMSMLAACREETPVVPVPPPSVLVQAAAPAEAGWTIYAGEVRARHETDLAFRVGGKMLSRSVDVGTTVAPGALLAQLDPADLQLNVAAVRAQERAAESDLALAQAEVDRYAALAAQKFVSSALLDAKTTLLKAASARLEQVRAQLAVSRNQANYGELRLGQEGGGGGGVITAVFAEAGQVVAPGQAIVRVARTAEKEVLIYVPEGRLGELKAASSVQISVWAQPSLKLRGQLRELAPAADPATRTYAARIRLLERAAELQHTSLQLGMTVQVAMPASQAAGIQLPLSAVIDRGQGAEVWVVRQDAGVSKVQRRSVQVATYQDEVAILTSGIKLGESVVVIGAHKLLPEQVVRPQPFQTAGK